MVTPTTTRRRPRARSREGAALLMCLFTLFVVSALLTNILNTETMQLATTRNTIEYEQSLYWANGGIHRACAELMQDISWRGPLTEGTVPPASGPSGFEVSATEIDENSILIQATGYSGQGVRSLEATIEH